MSSGVCEMSSMSTKDSCLFSLSVDNDDPAVCSERPVVRGHLRSDSMYAKTQTIMSQTELQRAGFNGFTVLHGVISVKRLKELRDRATRDSVSRLMLRLHVRGVAINGAIVVTIDD